MDKKFEISEKLLNNVLGYLGTQPYQEVFQLIQGLQNEVKEQVTGESLAR